MTCDLGRSGPALAPWAIPDFGPLLVNPEMVVFYPLDEVSGIAFDAHTGGYDLTPYANPGSGVGHVYPLARDYTGAPYHQSDGIDAPLRGGEFDWTWAGWVKLDSKATAQILVAKYSDLDPNLNGYMIMYHQGADEFRFMLQGDGAAGGSAIIDTAIGGISTGTWYYLVCWYDKNNYWQYIQIDNGTPVGQDLTAWGKTVGESSFPLTLGAYDNKYHMDGQLQCWGFWKSAAGGGGVLDAAQRQMLYNSGNGLTYAEMAAL